MEQLSLLFIVHVFLLYIFTFLPLIKYGQAKHSLPHLTTSFKFLFGINSVGGGTFALISDSLIFLCLLNAIKGGAGKHSAR